MTIELISGLVIGALLGSLAALVVGGRRQREVEADLADARVARAAAEARIADQDALAETMSERFRTLSAESARDGGEHLTKLARKELEPLLAALDSQRTQSTEMRSTLTTEVGRLVEAHHALREQTGQLASALARPRARGSWGEMTLRHVLETAGMSPHCDFAEQAGGDGGGRPDVTVRLPGDGCVVIDAKVPLDAYLRACSAEDEGECVRALAKHAEALFGHVRALSRKSYWAQFDRAPEFVILFLNVESSLVSALGAKPDLLERALRENVVIATPTILLGLLKSIALGWREHALTVNATEIADAGRELYTRLTRFTERMGQVGRAIESAGAKYDEMVGTFDGRLTPAARRLHGLAGESGDAPDAPAPLRLSVREIRAG